MSDPNVQLRERIENTIRFLSVDAVERAGCGHPGAPMGLAGVAFELFDQHLRFDPTDPEWPLRDRFILSNGHASMLLYSLLHLYGYDVSMQDLQDFRKLGSKTAGHPEYGDTPGVEVTTGPLGQGFAHGVGMALASRMTASHFAGGSDGPGDHFVYGIVGDGDLMEGVSYEAGSFAGHLGLGNLIYLYDDNQITIDGRTDISFSEDVEQRFTSQRWHVQRVDASDIPALRAALEAARAETGKPSLIIVRSTIGLGSPNRADTSKAHGEALGGDEVKLTKEAMGWPLEPDFLVPDDVADHLKTRVAAKRAEAAERNQKLDGWRKANAESAKAWDAARSGALPANLGEILSDGLAGVDEPTRKHGAKVLERLAEQAPYFVGGSADLAGSGAPPILKGRGHVGQGDDPFAGANIHFGVREHAMGAITNGITLDGTFRPYSGTFLIFSDYLRPSLRLAALMGVKSTFVFTHDSIFLGEDGPTHQPVEHLDSLRAMPNLAVWRPADGVETAMAWAWTAARAEGPSLLALSRQKVAALDRKAPFHPEDVWRGGYAVLDPGDQTRVVIVATGSEVRLACETAEKLRAEGLPARVVSLPCLSLFLEQPEEYRRSLIPDDGTPLVAVEAARGESLRALVGAEGLVHGVPSFGRSAPFADLCAHFGFTPDQLAAKVTAHVRSGDA